MEASGAHPVRLTEELRLRLADFNRGRNGAGGAYVISPATAYRPYYALWRVFDDQPCPLFVRTLALTAAEAVARAMQWLQGCNVPLEVGDSRAFEPFYAAADDLIPIGKYRGKRLSEIYYIDAPYVLWLANKFVPDNRKYDRLVALAQLFARVHFELTANKRQIPSVSRYVGTVGEKLQDLSLTVLNVRLQVDTYKPDFYVDQSVLATDRDGNRFTFVVKAAGKSLTPNRLNCLSRKVEPRQGLRIVSAKVLSHYEHRGVRYTRIGYVKWPAS